MFDSDAELVPGSCGWDPATLQWDCPAQSAPVADGGPLFRPWQHSDLDRFVALLDDPEIWQFLPEDYPAPLTHTLASELIALSNTAEHHVVRAVVLDGVPVGQVRLSLPPGCPDRRQAEIGYWLGRAHWGKRIATDMVARFSAQAFAMWPGLEEQFARVHTDNHGSKRLLVGMGFETAGPDPDTPGFERLIRRRP